MMIPLSDLEKLAQRHPHRRINSVVAEMKAKAKVEELRTARPSVAERDPFDPSRGLEPRSDWSFFRWMMGRES